ncbi:unnamed protein product [Ilex paraguariensis]|uniref:K-box domain-containing protein n=1 Tax=Ilex paraguariensis TaxID=185542 RepID=A0ABC8RT68_9AQUA
MGLNEISMMVFRWLTLPSSFNIIGCLPHFYHLVIALFMCAQAKSELNCTNLCCYCMEKILERYERYSYADRQLSATELDSQGNWTLEHAKLKARVETLQRSQRHFMGEDLDSLSLRELQNLEHQIDAALKHIRSRKNQLMHESISDLQKKDKALQDQNSLLAKKVKEKEKELAQQVQWEQQNHDLNPSSLVPSHPMDIGDAYQAGGSGEVEDITPRHHQTNTVMPPWMLRHLNG